MRKFLDTDSVRQRSIVFSILLIGCLVAFWPLFSAGYLVNYDDNVHFLQNPLIVDKHFSQILRILFQPNNTSEVYVPLTMLTFFFENLFFGQNPFVSHAINILLHLGVCSLAFLFARQLRLSFLSSAIAAFIFALHPLHVESIAWVSCRKDLVYSLFYLASLFAYCRYVDGGKAADYIFALALAGLSVLAKPMALSLPLVLFLVDFVKERPWRANLILEKIPFFLAVEPVAGITYLMNSRTTLYSGTISPLLWIWSATFYLLKFFLPFDLSILYVPPLPVTWLNPAYLSTFTTFFLVILITCFNRSNRILIFALGWYVFSMFFIWRFDTFDQQMVADRFMYLPCLGFCFLLGTLFDNWSSRTSARLILSGATILLLGFAVLTHARSNVWNNPYRLWTSVIQHATEDKKESRILPFALRKRAETVIYDDGFSASRHEVVGVMMRTSKGFDKPGKAMGSQAFENKLRAFRFALAIRDLKKGLSLKPLNSDLYNTLGIAFFLMKNYQRSEFYLRKYLPYTPWDGMALQIIGYDYEEMGKGDEALVYYDKAAATGVMIPSVFRRRAKLNYSRGRSREALSDAVKWLDLKPNDWEMYAFALERALDVGDIRTAEAMADKYVILYPDIASVHVGQAKVKLRKRDCSGAKLELKRAGELGHVVTREEESGYLMQCP